MQVPSSTAATAPEAFVRLSACCLALGLDGFTLSQLKWADYQTRNTTAPDFWHPYELFRGAVFMRPWAISHLNYLNGETLTNERLALIEPRSFYAGLDQHLRESDCSRGQIQLAEQAMMLTLPERARDQGHHKMADDLEMYYAQVDLARMQKKLITNTAKIRRLKAA